MIDCGEVNLELLRKHPLPRADEATDKDSRGRVLIIAGSALSPGAAVLSGTSALRAGAGKVMVATIESLAVPIGLLAPEFGVVPLPSVNGEPDVPEDVLERYLAKCDTILLGPGLSDVPNTRNAAMRVLQNCESPIVLDAAAIVAIRGHFDAVKRCRGPRVLTPHAGEMAALTGSSKEEVEKAPARFACDTAADTGCTVVLKGATTLIAGPDGRSWRHAGGVKGLATAGSGDALAGLLAGLLARGADTFTACIWSVAVHAKAGDILTDELGEVGFLARELPALFPPILRAWR